MMAYGRSGRPSNLPFGLADRFSLGSSRPPAYFGQPEMGSRPVVLAYAAVSPTAHGLLPRVRVQLRTDQIHLPGIRPAAATGLRSVHSEHEADVGNVLALSQLSRLVPRRQRSAASLPSTWIGGPVR